MHLFSQQKLLLDNIAQLPDIDDPPPVSSDGQFLILDGDVPGSTPRTQPTASESSEAKPALDSVASDEGKDPESEA